MPFTTTTTDLLFFTGLVLCCLGFLLFIYLLTQVVPLVPPSLGLRGFKRQLARQDNENFRNFESTIQYTAGAISKLPLDKSRRKMDNKLAQAGYWLGIFPDEIFALSFLAFMGSFLVLALACIAFSINILFAFIIAFFMGYSPLFNVGTEIAVRQQEVNRGLPNAVETMALCMSAGLDFPGSIRKIVENKVTDSALFDELSAILRDLDLGHTRSRALKAFGDRVPSDSIADFVSAIIQSESKGTPLKDILKVQAEMLRLQRSIKAEEAAARASILMLIPMIMLLVCALIMIVAPLVFKFAGWGES